MTMIVDLRSDTVTRPTPAMREAIASAEVGDDVLGDDPTVRRLETETARILGKEAALYVPSGTMGNELAVMVHTRPGDEVLVEQYCHILNAEGGAPARLAGVQLRALPSESGWPDLERVLGSVETDDDPHHAPTRLLCLENTHNRQGGRVWPAGVLEEMVRRVHERGLKVHLDGARLWNAAAATGRSEAELAAPADTVMVCFSKGLGAPVGSALAGPAVAIERARRERKRLGGGMRQAGILAAACLHALQHHRGRLTDDHRRARRLVHLADVPGDISILGGMPETNIIYFAMPARLPAGQAQNRLAEAGVRLSAFGPGLLRAVTHLDVDDEQIEYAGRCLRAVFAGEPAGRTA